MSVLLKPPDSGFQPDPTSVLMFGSLRTTVVARGAALGEKAAAEPSARASTVLAIFCDLRVGYRLLRCLLGGVRRLQLGRASRALLQCSANAVKSLSARRVHSFAPIRALNAILLTLGLT